MQAFIWYLEKGTQFSAREANAQLDARLNKTGCVYDAGTRRRLMFIRMPLATPSVSKAVPP